MSRHILVAGLLVLFGPPLWAEECSVDIEANDRIAFNVHAIEVSRSCQEFTVNLQHTGTLEKTLMGHNWVLARARDQQAVATAGLVGGLAHSFTRPGDARVLAATAVIGGGESTSVTFPVSLLEAGQQYLFFCSFPGHTPLMRGTLRLVD
ncbi:azurin [Pseudomonas sp. GCM10022188]|uniref:azurin n=1 Tax=Pseudomonas TaxID=286 RepID=UPI001E50A0AA|nr:azurin [Pseudomonas oryzagri]MCC6077546.1 azurin [Pseudomonas oryzagri]